MNGKNPPEAQNPKLSNPTPAPKEGKAPATVGKPDPRHPHDRDGNAQGPKNGAPEPPVRRP
jgi:hypothetical protein